MRLHAIAAVAGFITSFTMSTAYGQSAATPERAAAAENGRTRTVLAPFWTQRLTGYFKARDGVELRYTVLLPKGKGPFPAALHYSGYDPEGIGSAEYLKGNYQYHRLIEKEFVEAGYAVIGVNARATGCSGGDSFDWHRELYGLDGHDAIEFIASQSWSNGSVGMFSWSWPGMSQLWTASTRPPHLKAIAPGHVIANPRADSYAPGGVPQPAMISGWGSSYIPNVWKTTRTNAVAENDTRCLEQLDRNLKTLEAGAPGQLVLKHPFRDHYLEERNVSLRTHQINVPVLSITSFQDGATTSRAGYYQQTVDPKLMWMVDTNGGHSMYASEVYRKTLMQFFNHFVKGEKNSFESTPRLQIWQEANISDARVKKGGLEGRTDAAIPNWVITRPTITPEVTNVSFSLTEGGRLIEKGTPSGEPQTFKSPTPGPSTLGREGWGPMASDWKGRVLAFTSDPLDRDLIVYGPISADLWISSDVSDADVQVTVTAIQPDGQEMYVQRGWLRLSNRALDTKRSTPGKPVLLDSPESFAPMWPNRPELARIEVNRVSYPFRKGTRLRLWIDTPSQTGSYTFAYNVEPANLKILHDAEHPSKVVLNVLPGEAARAAAITCGNVLDQPCRPDPLAAR